MTTVISESLTVRSLTSNELSLCIPHGLAFHAEMKLPGAFLPDVFLKNWTARLNPDFPLPADILSLWKGDELVGGIGVVVVPDELDGRLVAQELFIFIDHAHRSGTGFLRLLRAFKDWCLEQGAVEGRLVHLLTLGETPTSIKLDGVYRKLGGTPTEVAYIIPITCPISIWEE